MDLHDNCHSFGMQRLWKETRGGENPQFMRMRGAAAGALRSRKGAAELEPRLDRERPFEYVAVCSGAPREQAGRNRFLGRGDDAAD